MKKFLGVVEVRENFNRLKSGQKHDKKTEKNTAIPRFQVRRILQVHGQLLMK